MERSELVELDKRYVWHPYTAMAQYRRDIDPLVIERAEGSFLYDVDGRRYIDGNGSWWVSTLGHRHPRLVAAAKRQLDSLAHVSLAGCTHEPAARLAEELVAIAPRTEPVLEPRDALAHVFFSDNGSTAIEVALKMCAQYWAQNGMPSRRTFVSMQGAFHGETIGATSVGGIEEFRGVFAPLLFDVEHLPSPSDAAGRAHALANLDALLVARSETIAGVVLEPLIQGASGMQMHPPEFVAAVRAATRRAGTFLIADEVFTGLGRTGSMFACDAANVVPDILCLAKSISGGVLPFAVTLATKRIFDGFLGDRSRAFMYGHSYCGNPLGAAIAREVLSIHRDERIIEQVRAKHVRLKSAFESLASTVSPGSSARVCGLVGAIDLGGAGYFGKVGWRVYECARRRGAYLRPLGDTVYVAPALNIADETLDELLEIVEASVLEALGRISP